MILLKICHLDFYFDVFPAADNTKYANGKDKILVNLGPTALFCNYELTTSNGNLIEDISHPLIVFPIKEPISIANSLKVLMICLLDSIDRGRNQDEFADNKIVNGK